MKNYRFNQIAMAVLGALLLFFGTKTLINIAYEEHEPEKPGLEVAGSEEHPGGGEVKPGGGAELATLLASGDEAKGAEIAKKCSICHSFDKGGPNMIGPDLYGVLGRKIASHEGYEYSDALKAKSSEDWTYENINHMIENPNAFAPGTKMALFPGLPDAKQRADVLLFLRTKNDNPPPLPEVTEEKPAGEETPGGGEAGDAAFLALVAKADPKQGEADAALCKVCHSFQKGGPAIVGPDLYGVVGRKIASVEGFNYTPALKAHEGDWTYSNLDVWLKNPQEFAPGTAMVFPGVADDKKRANIVAFLRANADTPAPLPEAGAAAPAAEEPAPAAEEPTPPAEEAAPPAEEATPPAEEAAPPAEEATPPVEEATPPAEDTAPPAEEAAPPAAEAPAPAEEAPAAEPETPAAPEQAAPADETPPTEEAAPAAPEETMTPEEEPAASSEPTTGEPPFANQPQPVYPEESSEDMSGSETMPASEDAEPSMGEPPFANQPQPVYPDGPAE